MELFNLKPISNDDKRIPLPPGTVIRDEHGIRYTIKNSEVGVGGSSLIYRVEREGTLRNFVLKECYPRSKDCFFIRRETDLVVCGEDDDDQYELDLVKDNMRRESIIGQILSQTTGRTISAWETLRSPEIILGDKIFNAKDACFVVMEQTGGGWFLSDLLKECAKPVQVDAPLQNGRLPSPYVATCIVEEILKSLRDINSAGYLHGDINDSNIFFMGCDPRNADIGVGQLIDFGNTLKLETDGKTAEIDEIFSSEAFSAPEIFERTGAVRLTQAVDIFSVGCLILYLVKGFEYKEIYDRKILSNFPVDTYVPLKTVMSRGYRREGAGVFRKILTKALRRAPSERYQSAKEMLDDVIFLKKIIQPPKFALPLNLSRSPYFVKGSRDKELAELQQALAEDIHPIWIFGTGGEGKTELAMEFARKEIERGRTAFLVRFNGSMKDTVLNMNFSGWRFEFDGQGDMREKEYQAKLDLLKENYENALMIIDNFDSETQTLAELQNEPAYKDLLNLNMKILFTTRSRPDGGIELAPLNDEDCLKLFRAIYKFPVDEEPIVRRIIREVDRHTMTVELLARTLAASWRTLTAKELLDLLRSQKLNAEELPEIMHRKDMTEREAKIYGHLRTLFNLVYSDEYREIFCDFTLIPPDGFDAAEFLLTTDKKKHLKLLENGGWVRRQAEDNLLLIHPLIRTILKNELKPTNADCKKFLDKLWSRSYRKFDEYPLDEIWLKKLGTIYVFASEYLGDPNGSHRFKAGHCRLLLRSFEVAFVYLKLSLETRQAILPKFDLSLAETYLETGLANASRRWTKGSNLKEAYECISKAIEIYEQTSSTRENFAEAYLALALVHEKSGNFPEAISLYEKVLEIFKCEPPKNEFKLACNHGNFGICLMKAGKYDESREHLQTALTILEKLTPQGHMNVITTYRALAVLDKVSGNLDSAFYYAEKMLKMLEEMQPRNIGEIGKVHGFIGELYSLKSYQMENPSDILFYLKKSDEALQLSQRMINTSMLPTILDLLESAKEENNNDMIIFRYYGAADCYRELKQYDEAEKYILSAVKEIMPDKTDPMMICKAYLSASQIYTDMKKFDLALDYAHRALVVYQKTFPNDEKNFFHVPRDTIHIIYEIIKRENL